MTYEQLKQKLYPKTRDMALKKVVFQHENKTYVYYSSLPDTYYKIDDEFERIYDILGFYCMERLQDQRILVVNIQQKDLNPKKPHMANLLFNGFVKKTENNMQQKYDSLVYHLSSGDS